LAQDINMASDIIDEMFLELPYDDINDKPTCTLCGFIATSGTLHTESCPIAPLENLLRKLRQTITYRSI